jgi:hypothetical protein
MSENLLSEKLMKRLELFDSKLEKLLNVQAPNKDGVLSESMNFPEEIIVENHLPAPLDINDRQESYGSSVPDHNPPPSRVAISAREMDGIIQKVEKINHDAELLERVEKLESQTRKISILCSMFMALTFLILGASVFLLVQVNFFNKGFFPQTQEKVAATQPFFEKNTTEVEKLHPTAPIAKVDDLKSSKPVSRVDDPTVAKAASPEPNSKPAKETAPVKYVGWMSSNKYHYPGCKWAEGISKYKHRTFSSAQEAREKGFIPCPTCRPPRSD